MYSRTAPQRRSNNNAFRSNRPRSYGGQSNNNRRGPARQNINPSRFVKKAVALVDEAPYVPLHHFSDFGLSAELQANLEVLHYDLPTPIQDQSIPHAMAGKDVLGIANTGTGKTAAFLLPLIERILNDPDQEMIMVVAPTRELALQIQQSFVEFARGLRLGSTAVIGGAPITPQLMQLKRVPHMVIGTPGRIKDMIERGAIRTNRFTAVVLDEVDRMLDMGFVQEIRELLSGMPETKQSLFFSATLSPEIERLINTFMKEPVKIVTKTAETADAVDQDVVYVPHDAKKIEVLHDLLIQPHFEKVLIFGETKRSVERLADDLVDRGFTATAIHGNKTQGQRVRAMDAFKQDRVKILVATDVAARGLDIKDVSHVINYDLPQTYDDYVHRIGRTGRAGQRGQALTFI